MSDGLTAVYKFETRLGNGGGWTESQKNNQLYAGLSGGFGNLTLGRFHNAAYHAGGIRDIGNWYSSGDVSTKVGNTVSYAFSSAAFSLQVDAIMDSRDTGKSIDEAQFGMTVSMGDIGKVALGYEKVENTLKSEKKITQMAEDAVPEMYTVGAGDSMTYVVPVMIRIATNDANLAGDDKLLVQSHLDGAITKDAKGYQIGSCTDDDGDPDTALPEDLCVEKLAYVHVKDTASTTYALAIDSTTAAKKTVTGTPVDTEEVTFYLASAVTTVDEKPAVPEESIMESVPDVYGYKASHISAAFGLGGTTVGLGYSSMDSNDPAHEMKKKTTYLGANGGIGDTGLDWRAWGRKVEGHDGEKTNPWGIGLGKALGGGAYAWVEHSNSDSGDDEGATFIALNVNF